MSDISEEAVNRDVTRRPTRTWEMSRNWHKDQAPEKLKK
jgi:hypothetical protein